MHYGNPQSPVGELVSPIASIAPALAYIIMSKPQSPHRRRQLYNASYQICELVWYYECHKAQEYQSSGDPPSRATRYKCGGN